MVLVREINEFVTVKYGRFKGKNVNTFASHNALEALQCSKQKIIKKTKIALSKDRSQSKKKAKYKISRNPAYLL